MIRELIYDMAFGENKSGDIVAFYNNYFIQTVKNFILQTARNIGCNEIHLN
jgi:hypothetical protein